MGTLNIWSKRSEETQARTDPQTPKLWREQKRVIDSVQGSYKVKEYKDEEEALGFGHHGGSLGGMHGAEARLCKFKTQVGGQKVTTARLGSVLRELRDER